MVQAIISGKKTVTRRVVKQKYDNTELKMKTDKYGTYLVEIEKDVEGVTYGKRKDGTPWRKIRGYITPKPPYQKYDFLYVRETWNTAKGSGLFPNWQVEGEHYIYKADAPDSEEAKAAKWRPAIHMPRKAARIFLLVTDVRVERLQEITEEDIRNEGIDSGITLCSFNDQSINEPVGGFKDFFHLWNSTIPKKDLAQYGWKANPWVWVIEFQVLDIEDKSAFADHDTSYGGLQSAT